MGSLCVCVFFQGVTFSFAHGHSRWAGESRLQRCIFFGAIIGKRQRLCLLSANRNTPLLLYKGYFVGRFTPLMQTLAPLMLKYAGWELDVAARWPSTVSE